MFWKKKKKKKVKCKKNPKKRCFHIANKTQFLKHLIIVVIVIIHVILLVIFFLLVIIVVICDFCLLSRWPARSSFLRTVRLSSLGTVRSDVLEFENVTSVTQEV